MLKLVKGLILLISIVLTGVFLTLAIESRQQVQKKHELPILKRNDQESDYISAVGCLIFGGASDLLISTFKKRGHTHEN